MKPHSLRRYLIVAGVIVAAVAGFVAWRRLSIPRRPPSMAQGSAVTAAGPAACPSNVPPPNPQEALKALFGPPDAQGRVRVADDQRAAVWIVQCFEVGGITKAAVFTQTQPVDSDGEVSAVHAFAASIGAVVYRLSGDTWALESKQADIVEAGSFGAAPPLNHMDVVALGKGGVGFLFEDGGMAQGYVTVQQSVLGYSDAHWAYLGALLTAESNEDSQECEDAEAGKGAKATCYDYSSTVSVDAGQGDSTFDLLVHSEGKIPSGDGHLLSQRDMRYRFDGKKYVAAPGN